MGQIGSSDDEEKPRFAQLNKEHSLETITLEEALDLFKLPRVLGELDGTTVSVGVGRFGPYVRPLHIVEQLFGAVYILKFNFRQ